MKYWLDLCGWKNIGMNPKDLLQPMLIMKSFIFADRV